MVGLIGFDGKVARSGWIGIPRTERKEMNEPDGRTLHDQELTEREQQVLEAVVRSYVESAEPAGSRTITRRFDLGVSPATVRNTMSDLEEKGYLLHPHASAGRVPTDLAYRFFVDRIIRPLGPSDEERAQIAEELDQARSGVVDRLVRRAATALGILSQELGIAALPKLRDAILEKLELVQASTSKILLVATIRSGFVRTVYVDVSGEVPPDTLVTLTLILNERLAGLSLYEIRETLPLRLRDVASDDDPRAEEVLNIFMQSGSDLFAWPDLDMDQIHLGQASVLAQQPEFTTGERLKGLIELTERKDILAAVLGGREHQGGLRITIGTENEREELSDFTLVTAEYRVGGMKGVIGVIGPTRMAYEKVISIVDYTSSLVNEMLRI